MGDDNFNNASTSVSFTVTKHDVGLKNTTIDVDVVADDNDVTIVVNVDKSATGLVEFNVDGKAGYIAVNNGKAVYNIDLPAGDYTVVATYLGDSKFNSNKTSKAFTVSGHVKENTTITSDVAVDESNVTITVNVDEKATGYVEIVISGIKYYVPVVGGVAIFRNNYVPGSYVANVNYLGDDNFNPTQTDVSFDVVKNTTSTTINVSSTVNNGTVTIDVEVNDDATGYVFVDVNGTGYYAKITGGKAHVNIVGLNEGNYTAVVTYPGDEKYKNASASVYITVPSEPVVEPKDPNLKATAANTTIAISVDKDATGNILVDVGDQGYYAPINGGKAIINVIGLDEGKYDALVSYVGDDIFKSANVTVSITVPKKEDPQPEPVDPKADIKISNETVSVDLPTDATGYVLVDVGGNGYYTAVKDGKATLDLPELAPGNYTVTVTYTGDRKYDSANATQNITVEEDIHTVVAENLTKVEKASDCFVAKFTDAGGNPLVNTKVTFEINGGTYTRTTDANGQASIAINLNAGNYTIVTTNPVTKEVAVNTITVLSRFVENHDLTKYFRNASQYVVKVLGDDGQVAREGEVVTFNINGVFYNRTVNASGHVKLNINLEPGDYVITAEYKGCKVSNNIDVLPVLTGKDITKKYGVDGAYEVTLVDGQGKAYANQKIELNVNGVLYYRTTNSSGIAKLNINLQPGKYIITASYDYSRISNSVTVTA